MTTEAARFQSILKRLMGTDGFDPWFYDYVGDKAARPVVYVRFHRDLLRLAKVDVRDSVTLDAGCGFGPACLVYAIFGAREVHGIDFFEPMVDTVQRYKPLLPGDIASKLNVRLGSASELPYPDESFDVILSNEAISHYLDVPGFVHEAARCIRPGGTIIVADSNNALNRRHRSEVFDIWEEYETGSRAETDGVISTKHFPPRRREIIERAEPSVSPEDAWSLARHTTGMLEGEIVEAAREFVESGVMPDRSYRRGTLAVSPEGQVLERLMNPRELVAQFEDVGLAAHAVGYWGGATGNRLVRSANRLLELTSPLTLSTTRNFRVIARKPR